MSRKNGLNTSIGSSQCLTYNDIVNSYDGSVVENADGTVSVFISNGSNQIPLPLSKLCCEALKNTYVFDITRQTCRWSSPANCNLQDAFKLVLNPNGNDGTLFYTNDSDNCVLTVDFDYLFKVKCETLGSIQAAQPQILIHKKNQVQLSQGPVESGRFSEQTNTCESIANQIAEYTNMFSNTSYSIVCNSIPETTIAQPVLVKSVGNSAFGKIAPFSFGSTLIAGQVYCLNEPNGLSQWRTILGDVRYNAFINGDQTSYTCDDVLTIFKLNDVIVQNNIINRTSAPTLISECDTPLNTKSDLMGKIVDLMNQQNDCNDTLSRLSSQAGLTVLNPITLQTEPSCETPIDFFESFDASMSIDIITSANTLETVYSGSLLTAIGSGNLYTYLVTNTNSGFYVCGDPTGSETQPNCTPLLLNLTGGSTNNVFTCDNVVDNLVNSLYNEFTATTGTTLSDFQNSLPPNAFASQWLHYHAVITDPNILALIANQKIKLSININFTCGDFCVLVDEISLDKVCTNVKENNIFLTQSPGFELDRIRDNKKSWIANTTPTNRPFVINNNKGGNSIRQTNYDVNDERLVINTKEIDLDISIASAIETDVWCYIVNNPCLLSSCSCPAGYELSPTQTECIQTLTTDAILSGTPYTGYMSAQISSYNNLGARFYENITNKAFPLTTEASGGLPLLDATGGTVGVQVYTTIYSSITSTFWGDAPSTSPTKGRLNNIGVWSTPYTGGTQLPINQWIGFTKCVDVPETKEYYIGIAGDNQVRFSVNGVMIAEFANNSSKNFNFWHVFPITLNSGVNIIEMQGLNTSSQASFGAEIYNPSDFSTLTASTSTATTGNIFSTADMVGETFILADNNGYSCPTGYALSTCSSGTPYCVKINRIPMTGCVQTVCDPCTVITSCVNKQFMDDDCYNFMDAEIYQFMDSTDPSQLTALTMTCCGDNRIAMGSLLTQDLSKVTTIEDFEYFLTSELIDAKNRQTLSGYPTLRALYDRYLNSNFYCGNNSSMFDYMTMDQFANLVGTYWVDIVEQVIPATTIWGSTIIYGNTIFDQQKFKYRNYSSLFCGNPFSGQTILSPINGVSGECANVSVETTTLISSNAGNIRFSRPKPNYCDTLCIAQMNSANEFIGRITIAGPNCDVSNGGAINENTLQASVVTNYPTASVVLVGATQPIIYQWSNGATGATATFSAGSYSVMVIDGSCNEANVEFDMPTPGLTACWYSMQESPEYISRTLGSDYTAITLSLISAVINGVELISGSGFSTTFDSSTINIISGFTGMPGFTYTNFVDMLNNAFTTLGLSAYTAQVSLVSKGVMDSNSNAGFYIIRPVGETFTLKTDSSVGSPFDLAYHENDITLWDGSSLIYYGYDCSNITIVDGVVIE